MSETLALIFFLIIIVIIAYVKEKFLCYLSYKGIIPPRQETLPPDIKQVFNRLFIEERFVSNVMAKMGLRVIGEEKDEYEDDWTKLRERTRQEIESEFILAVKEHYGKDKRNFILLDYLTLFKGACLFVYFTELFLELGLFASDKQETRKVLSKVSTYTIKSVWIDKNYELSFLKNVKKTDYLTLIMEYYTGLFVKGKQPIFLEIKSVKGEKIPRNYLLEVAFWNVVLLQQPDLFSLDSIYPFLNQNYIADIAEYIFVATEQSIEIILDKFCSLNGIVRK